MRLAVTPGRAWGAAIGVAVLASITELLPVVFGTGSEASADWGFTYVTLRFVLLPSVCLILIFSVAVGLVGLASSEERLLSLSALVVPASYLALLWFHPLFFLV